MTMTAWGSTSKFYTRRPVAGLCVPNGIAEGHRSWSGRTDLLFRGCGAEIRDFDQVFPRFLWPIQEKLKECWDGPPSAIWVTSSRVRGYGCRKTRRENKRSCRCSKRFGGEASAITPTTPQSAQSTAVTYPAAVISN